VEDAALTSSVPLSGLANTGGHVQIPGQRTHEIGVCLALGASSQDIFRLVIGRGMLLASIGAALGLVAAFELARYLETLLFQIKPHDGLTFTAAPALLLSIIHYIEIKGFPACEFPLGLAGGFQSLLEIQFVNPSD
jgi:ABC-type lipoprotein release transport system permease subunit